MKFNIKSVRTSFVVPLWVCLCALAGSVSAAEAENNQDIPSAREVIVWGTQKDSAQAGYTSPVSTLKPDDLHSINMATTEDAVKYEPSVVIRRRFIGDANGTLGIRGSNMFQTSRSMVFADGIPLHYLLQSRFNGAPRWTLVSASEIAQVDVIYGPFSAEYSGNAMGGVILIETEIPQQQQIHVNATTFTQQFKAYGFADTLNGYKSFVSYGNKVGDLSLYFSYNHLDNKAQPQTFNFNSITGTSTTSVSGGIVGNDSLGAQKIYYGDTGVVDTVTDNFKFKLGYDFGKWQSLLNIAYEDRFSESVGNSYIVDDFGNKVWSGTVNQNGDVFSINASSLGASVLERDSLNLGLRLRGDVSDTTEMEINLNRFDVLKDERGNSAVNPNDAAFDGSGKITAFDNTGWRTAGVKWTIDDLGLGGLSLLTGLRYEEYELNIKVYDSNDYAGQSKDVLRDSSGGKTSLSAAFAQLNWVINPNWDSTFGLRFETWHSSGGYFDNDASAATDLVFTPARSEDRVSPKFSIGYKSEQDWLLRYSLAKAYRFPIVEELYSQFEAFSSRSLANPDLEPENGLHHNLMFEYGLKKGYLRVNLFHENIKDVIESQSTILPGGGSLRTFIPIDEVATTGLELIVNNKSMWFDALDIRFNLTYTDSEIVSNAADRSIEGNRFPRLPQWRSNLLATYHLSSKWDISGNLQYASDSFGRLDNRDTEDNVFGAIDAYTRIGVKTVYAVNKKTDVSFGIDNLTDEEAYVVHPWPGRTFYLSVNAEL